MTTGLPKAGAARNTPGLDVERPVTFHHWKVFRIANGHPRESVWGYLAGQVYPVESVTMRDRVQKAINDLRSHPGENFGLLASTGKDRVTTVIFDPTTLNALVGRLERKILLRKKTDGFLRQTSAERTGRR